MNNLRQVKDDILKDWIEFREEILATLDEEDKKHHINFEDISENILNSIPKQNRYYVQKQLEQLNRNFLDYNYYWNEKYYRNGFVDGVQLLGGCFEE